MHITVIDHYSPRITVAMIDYKTFPMFPSHYGCYYKSYS